MNEKEAGKKLQEFDTEQLKAADTLSRFLDNTEQFEEEAIRIGLMTEETRSKIRKNLGDNHINILKGNIARISGNADKDPYVDQAGDRKDSITLRLAIKRTYGKFLFDEDFKTGDPQFELAQHFEHTLDHILKNEINETHRLKLRSELLVARRRLIMSNTNEMTDPNKAAETDDRRNTLNRKISELENLINIFDKVRSTPQILNHETLFVILPDFINFIIKNQKYFDSNFVDKCKNFKIEFKALLTSTGLSQNSTKADFDSAKKVSKNIFRKFRDNHFSSLMKTIVVFTETELHKANTELDNKKSELAMVDYSVAEEILEEAFTIDKALTPEEADKQLKAANAELALLTAPATPLVVGIDLDKAKVLLKSPPNKSDLKKAIGILRNIQGYFDNKKDRDKIASAIDNLERITGIKPKVAVERAVAKKEEADSKVKKTEEVRAHMLKNKSSEIGEAYKALIKGVDKNPGSKLHDKQITNADNIAEDCYRKNLKEAIVELDSIITTQGKLENFAEPSSNIIQTVPSTSQQSATPTSTPAEQRREAGQKKATAEKEKATILALQASAKVLYEFLLPFTEDVCFLAKNGFLNDSYKYSDIEPLLNQLKSMNPETQNVSIKDFDDLYVKLANGGWFKIWQNDLPTIFSEKISQYTEDADHADTELKKKQDALHAIHDLSDTEAAKRIIFAIVKRQHPDMNPNDQHALADLILANDVATIQSGKSYEQLAKEGSEDLEKLVKEAGEHKFKWKILRFKYKEGDKVVEPFKDLKPGDVNVWAKIEKLFNTGKLDYKAGFFLLAGLHEFFGEDKGTFTIVYTELEKKLRKMIEEKLGVKERTTESYIRKVVDEAFDKQLKKSRGLMKAYSEHYDKNETDINSAKIKELKHRLTEIDEKRRLGKMNQEVYEEKFKKIMKEADDYGVKDKLDISQNEAMRGYWNSPEAQWMKDLGMNLARLGKDKAKALGMGTLMTGINGAWGATKLGASIGFQAAMTPVRAAKYPLILAAKPIVGFLNLFKKQKWQPSALDLSATFKNDVNRVMGYAKTKGTETIDGAKKKTVEAYSKPWEGEKYTNKDYKDRSKVKLDEETERIKELAEKSTITPLEVTESPAIDFDAIKKQIADADQKFKGGHAGHTEEKKTGTDGH